MCSRPVSLSSFSWPCLSICLSIYLFEIEFALPHASNDLDERFGDHYNACPTFGDLRACSVQLGSQLLNAYSKQPEADSKKQKRASLQWTAFWSLCPHALGGASHTCCSFFFSWRRRRPFFLLALRDLPFVFLAGLGRASLLQACVSMHCDESCFPV